jgi:stage V sporulation protein R
MRAFPESPVRDVIGFVARHAPLARWQQEILEIVREEAMYFAPQAQTKIMNEGWATYWHTHLMTRHVLRDDEVIDYCDHHSGTVAQQPGRLNPYKLGVELWRNIETRWNRGQHGPAWAAEEDPATRRAWDTGAGAGRAKLFEVRRTHNDVTFLDTFLTEEFCREQGFFTTKYDAKAREWVLDSTEFADVKRGLLAQLASRGTPRVSVVDANAFNRGELRLWHEHEGHDLQLDVSTDTLANLAALWGRPVHCDTRIDGQPVRLTHDGTTVTRAERPEEP